jgi:predicted small secreted protein
MKRTIIVIIILVACCSACSLVAYRAGFGRAVQLLGSDGDVYLTSGTGELHVQNGSVTNSPTGSPDQAKAVWKAAFVMSMGALDKLRAGDTSDGIRKIESLCFASAFVVYSDPAYHDSNVSLLYAPDLIQYRSQYRSNRAEWTPAETNLETILKQFN